MKKVINKLASILDDKRWDSVSIPILSILLSFICISIILLVMGKDPLLAFKSFLQGSGFWPKESTPEVTAC